MSKSIAVAIVHGTGRKEPGFADDTIDRLHEMFPKHLTTENKNRANLVVEPVYWADLTRKREDEIWERVKDSGPMDNLDIRRFILMLRAIPWPISPARGGASCMWTFMNEWRKGLKNWLRRPAPKPRCVFWPTAWVRS